MAESVTDMVGPASAASMLVYRLLGPGAEAVGEAMGDYIRVAHKHGLERFKRKLDESLARRGLDEPARMPALLPAIEIVRNGCFEEDSDLQDIWAALLAASVDPSAEVHRSFVGIVSELDPADVRFLSAAYSVPESLSRGEDGELLERYRLEPALRSELSISGGRLGELLGVDLADLLVSMDNLKRLRCIEAANVRAPTGEEENFLPFRITSLGIALLDTLRLEPILDAREIEFVATSGRRPRFIATASLNSGAR